MIELRTLGAIELTSADGRPLASVLTQPRRTALLSYLTLVSPRGFRRRDSVLATFWPEHDTDQARHALRQSIYFLRQALGAATIVSRGDDELGVPAGQVRCDAIEFERALDGGRLEDALALYRGDLLSGFHLSGALEFERWLETERSRLRQRAADAAWTLSESRERAGDHAGASEWGRRAVGLTAGDEIAFRRLLELFERIDNRAAAMRAYDAFARELEREYELTPSDATRQLLARIRSEQRPSAVAAAPNGPHESPSASALPALAGGLVATPDREGGAPPSRKFPVGAGAAALIVVAALGVGAWQFGVRSRSSAEPRQPTRVIVADFANLTSDSTAGDLAAQVLTSELARSPVIRVAGRESIGDALRRMRRSPDDRVTAEVAREVATREQINLIVEGDVRSAGSELILTAKVIETASGDVVVGASDKAQDSTDVIAAITRLSNRLREGIGESRASIHETEKLARFTTSSLPALRKQMAGSQAWLRGDYRLAADLYTEAITLDPEFAYAHLQLSGALVAAGAPRSRAVASLGRAYELRDRLTDRERYAVEGQYHLVVTGDLAKAIVAFRRHVDLLKQLPPGELGLYASFGTALATAGDVSEAVRVLQEARVRRPTVANQARLIRLLYADAKTAEAGRILDELTRRQPEHPAGMVLRAQLLADSGRYDDAHALASRARRGDDVRTALTLQASLDATHGHLAEAIEHLRELKTGALARGELSAALETAAAIGMFRSLAGDRDARREVDDVLAGSRIDSLDAMSRPHLPLAQFYADVGAPREARVWLSAYERDVPAEFRGPDRWSLHWARAALQRAEGKYDQALAETREAARYPQLRAGVFNESFIRSLDRPELARTYDALGAADSAIAVYERYVSARSLDRTTTDAFALGSALERLGALYQAQGDRARAAERFRRLALLWRNADDPLRQRAAVATQRASVQ
jgi:DNA-binding SARP family transcriptional activator/TolB-like protein/thioredoxin-like negative regulator of GroEL